MKEGVVVTATWAKNGRNIGFAVVTGILGTENNINLL